MQNLGGWDTGFGVQLWAGDATPVDAAGEEEKLVTDAWVIDAQALGMAGGMPLSLYASYGSAKGDPESIWNTSPDDAKAFALLGQLGIMAGRGNVYLGYSSRDSGADTNSKFNAVTAGGQYLLAQNIRLELFHVAESGSGVDARPDDRDARTMFQLFAGF